MKNPLLLVAASASLMLAASPVGAQTNILAPLGTDNFTVDGGSTTASYTQTTTNLTLVTPFTLGDTLGGVFSTAYDWSAYSNSTSFTFGFFMSALAASPGIPFTVEFFNGALDTIVNTYTGEASGLSASPSFVSMNLSLPGSGDFSSIGGMQFTWDGSSTGSVVLEGVAVVPEPTTWAMLAFGAILFGGLALRRRLAAVRR